MPFTSDTMTELLLFCVLLAYNILVCHLGIGVVELDVVKLSTGIRSALAKSPNVAGAGCYNFV